MNTLTTPLINDTVIIRPAAAGDFEWVADLIVESIKDISVSGLQELMCKTWGMLGDIANFAYS